MTLSVSEQDSKGRQHLKGNFKGEVMLKGDGGSPELKEVWSDKEELETRERNGNQ